MPELKIVFYPSCIFLFIGCGIEEDCSKWTNYGDTLEEVQ
jgi:hypothetical protein